MRRTDGQRVVPERAQAAQQHRHAAEELQPLGHAHLPVGQPPLVLGEDLQAAGLVAGQRAELDMLADRAEQADLLPGQ
jgi:hypothetical protein